MKMSVDRSGEKVKFTLDGRLDESTSPEVEERLMTLIAGKDDKIALNMQRVNYISSAGIRVLILAHKKALKTGSEITISAISDKAAKVLNMVGISRLFSPDR